MRNAQDFVEEYRRKGYPDDRIRIIASMRPEPLRSEVLEILGQKAPKAESAPSPAPGPAEEETAVIMEDVAPPVAAEKEAVEQEPAPAEEAAPPKKKVIKKPASVAESSAAIAKTEPLPPPARRGDNAKPDKTTETLRKEIVALRKDRDHVADQLAKAKAKSEKLTADNAQIKELRKQAAEAEAVHKELEEIRSERADLAKAEAELQKQVADLEAALAEKDALLNEKDNALAKMDSMLSTERAEYAHAASHLGELQTLSDKQTERLRELSGLDRQLTEANEALEQLREEAVKLHEREQANVSRVTQLAEKLNVAQEETDALRTQIDANEQALKVLEEKLDAREGELESLREHFEREATDLKKRSEQEMWMIHRKLTRFRRGVLVSGTLAAILIVALSVGLVSQAGRAADAEREVAALRSGRPITIADERATPPEEVTQTPTDEAPKRMLPAHMEAQQVTPSEAPIETAPPKPSQPAARYYTVKKGDNLWNIAQKFYKDGAKSRLIREANRLPDDRLQPGMKLRIPIKETAEN